MSAVTDDLARAAGLIREVPDFPEPGVLFRDLAPVFADPAAFRAVVDALAGHADGTDVVIGIEARGFLLGAAVAYARGLGVIGVRKPGKLPVVAHREDYALEYDTATLELAEGVLRPGTWRTSAGRCAVIRRAIRARTRRVADGGRSGVLGADGVSRCVSAATTGCTSWLNRTLRRSWVARLGAAQRHRAADRPGPRG